MQERLDLEIETARLNKQALALLFIDLDGFKLINDNLGHNAGDLLLKLLAERIRHSLRPGDLATRLGADEFLVLLGQIDAADESASNIAANLIASLSEPIELDDGQQVRVGASVGMASFPRHGQTRKQLLHAADIAMYEVKRTGKNSFAMAVDAVAGS